MNVKIQDGELSINIEDLVRSDPAIMRECIKHALFDELVLKALSEIIVKGEVEWAPDEHSWWMGGGDRARFEQARVVLAELADEGTRKLMEEMRELRDREIEQRRIYQNRAWDAEHIIQYAINALQARYADDPRILARINRISRQPAWADPVEYPLNAEQSPNQ